MNIPKCCQDAAEEWLYERNVGVVGEHLARIIARHHHGAETYVISEAMRRVQKTIQDLKAENERLREVLGDCVQWMKEHNALSCEGSVLDDAIQLLKSLDELAN